MVWSLEIHHLDVRSCGDATLIIAREPTLVPPVVRTVLIDGGKTTGGAIIHARLQALGIAHLDVIAVTHYDKDHVQGITPLLNMAGVNMYDRTIIYDLGAPRFATRDYNNYVAAIANKVGAVATAAAAAATAAGAHGAAAAATAAGNPAILAANNVITARAAARTAGANKAGQAAAEFNAAKIARRTAVSVPTAAIAAAAAAGAAGGVILRHATAFVNNFDIVQYNPNDIATIPIPAFPLNAPALAAPLLALPAAYLDPYWLVGKEIMWGNGMDGLQGRPPFASAPPAGAPTVTCIVANKYALQGAPPHPPVNVAYIHDPRIYNGPNRMPDADIADEEVNEPNALSLAFLVQFNNFKYYVGGDLESEQEDGCFNNGAVGGPIAQPGVMVYLNANDNIAGRVLAMKASHHGSDLSTSRNFVDRVRPAIAIISTGLLNQHQHPGEECVNVLDGYERLPINNDPANNGRHPPQPPVPPYRPVPHYLTGFQEQVAGDWLSFGGDRSETAGDPRPASPARGHIRLDVTHAQSLLPVVGQAHRGITAAVNAVLAALGPAAAALGAVNVASIAEKSATYGSSTAAAVAAAMGLVVPPPSMRPHLAALGAADAMAYVGTDVAGVGAIDEALAATANAANVIANATAAAIPAGNAAANAIAAGGGALALQSRARAAAIAAAMTDLGNPVAGVGVGGTAIAAAIGVVVAGAAAVAAGTFTAVAFRGAISAAFLAAAPGGFVVPATPAQAAQATSIVAAAAIAFNHPNVGPGDAAFGAVAAIGAMRWGANVTQAVAIAAALIGTVCNLNGHDMATLTTQAIMAAPGAVPATAALAGAVAGSTWQEGVAAEVTAAVAAALTAAGLAAAAVAAGNNAQAAAAAIAPNGLFNLQYTVMNAPAVAGGPPAPGNHLVNDTIS
jgi:hypothetical protein